jgi:hypothetical protein
MRRLISHPTPQSSPTDLTDRRFGKLTAITLSGSRQGRSLCWVCECDCGRRIEVPANRLRAMRTWHCGCQGHGRHGMVGTKVYRAWQAMKERCHNPNHAEFHNYGGRGIKVCDEWRDDFLAFYEHIGDPPTDKHTIDRIDFDGDYEPDNVRWATPKEQARNQRSNRLVVYKGQSRCVNEWAEILGIKPITLYFRLRNGWSVERAFEEPVQSRRIRWPLPQYVLR